MQPGASVTCQPPRDIWGSVPCSPGPARLTQPGSDPGLMLRQLAASHHSHYIWVFFSHLADICFQEVLSWAHCPPGTVATTAPQGPTLLGCHVMIVSK